MATFVTLIVCSIGSLAMLIVSFTFAIISRNDFIAARLSLKDMIDDWGQDMVFDLSVSHAPYLPDNQHYVAKWVGRWPGTKDGCYCTKSDSDYEVNKGLQGQVCNHNETIVGCSDIAATSARDLEKWLNGHPVYAVKIKNTSFLATYKNIKSNGKCKNSDLMHCGNPNSKSKGFCIPASIGKCPVTKISTTSGINYKPVIFPGMTLYTTNDTENNPVCHLQVRESHMCFVKSRQPVSTGRKPYLLYDGNFDDCRVDKTAFNVGEVGEKTFLDINGLNYSKLVDIGVSENYKYRYLAARMLDWSPDCSDTIPTMQAKNQEFDTVSVDFRNMVIVYSISFGLTLITLALIFVFSLNAHYVKTSKILFIIRTLLFIMALTVMVLIYVKVRESYSLFEKIQKLECSTAETNENFVELTKLIKDKAGYKTEVALGVGIGGYCLDVFLCGLFLWFIAEHPKSRSNEIPRSAAYSPSNPTSVGLKTPQNQENIELMTTPQRKNSLIAEAPKPLPPGFTQNSNPLPPGFLDQKN